MGIYKPKETSREVDYSRLLFSHRDVTVYDYPFFHGCIDNYLPSQSYRYLLQDFPKQALYINYGARGAMDNDDPRLKNFWSKNPFSKSLLDFFSSETFLEDLQKFVMPAVPRERGYSDQRSWYYVNDWSKARKLTDKTPINATFKFSPLTPGEWIPPHTDNPGKLLSILLYFAESDWRESYGGGTEIYEPKHALLKHNWRNIEMPFELMKRWRTFAFLPNRLVFFLKSSNSWHGVSPVVCPEGRSRKSLLITLYASDFQTEMTIHRTARALIRSWMRFKGYP